MSDILSQWEAEISKPKALGRIWLEGPEALINEFDLRKTRILALIALVRKKDRLIKDELYLHEPHGQRFPKLNEALALTDKLK